MQQLQENPYEWLLAQTKVMNALCNCDNNASKLFIGFHSVDCEYRKNQELRGRG